MAYTGAVMQAKAGLQGGWIPFSFFITHSFDFIDKVPACILTIIYSLINLINSVYSLMIGF